MDHLVGFLNNNPRPGETMHASKAANQIRPAYHFQLHGGGQTTFPAVKNLRQRSETIRNTSNYKPSCVRHLEFLPMVEMKVVLKASSEKRNSTQVFPTPESPISSSLNSKSYVFFAIEK